MAWRKKKFRMKNKPLYKRSTKRELLLSLLRRF
jgi:hypothetical protein